MNIDNLFWFPYFNAYDNLVTGVTEINKACSFRIGIVSRILRQPVRESATAPLSLRDRAYLILKGTLLIVISVPKFIPVVNAIIYCAARILQEERAALRAEIESQNALAATSQTSSSVRQGAEPQRVEPQGAELLEGIELGSPEGPQPQPASLIGEPDSLPPPPVPVDDEQEESVPKPVVPRKKMPSKLGIKVDLLDSKLFENLPQTLSATEDRNKIPFDWISFLPINCQFQIMARLSVKERLDFALTCKRWFLNMDELVWTHFAKKDFGLTTFHPDWSSIQHMQIFLKLHVAFPYKALIEAMGGPINVNKLKSIELPSLLRSKMTCGSLLELVDTEQSVYFGVEQSKLPFFAVTVIDVENPLDKHIYAFMFSSKQRKFVYYHFHIPQNTPIDKIIEGKMRIFLSGAENLKKIKGVPTTFLSETSEINWLKRVVSKQPTGLLSIKETSSKATYSEETDRLPSEKFKRFKSRLMLYSDYYKNHIL